MYSGIHVFSLANILKTGSWEGNEVKDSVYSIFRIEGNPHFGCLLNIDFPITKLALRAM